MHTSGPQQNRRIVPLLVTFGALILGGCATSSTAGPGTTDTTVITTTSAATTTTAAAPSTTETTAVPTSQASERGPGVRADDPPQITGRLTVGTKPCGVVGGNDRVWVSSFGSGTVRYVDPQTLEMSKPITVGTKPCGVAVGAGSLWVENYGSDNVTRIDLSTGEVLSTIAVGSAPYDVTFFADAAWVTDYGDGTVSRIDAMTEERTVIQVRPKPIGIVAAGGTVWVAHENGDLLGIDPATSTVTVRTSIGSAANWTAADGDNLWVGGRFNNDVVHLDATTAEVLGRYEIGALPLDGDVVDGVAWFPDKTGKLHELPADPKSAGRVIDSGVGWPFVIAGYDGSIWAPDFSGTDLVRIDPSATP